MEAPTTTTTTIPALCQACADIGSLTGHSELKGLAISIIIRIILLYL